MKNRNNSKKFDAFVCYETTTGKGYAQHLKESLKKVPINCFVAAGKYDIPVGKDEKKYRYKVINESEFFILIITNMALSSKEVKSETNKALKNQKEIIICLNTNVDHIQFEKEFPQIANKQRIKPFSDKYELAKEVSDLLIHSILKNNAKKFDKQDDQQINQETGLIVEPEWSINKISNTKNVGHIIFKIKNNTGKKILLFGYQMYRITPEGERTLYYHKVLTRLEDFARWVYSPHFRITLWNNDEHVFHWNDVNIIKTYGINKKGKWGSEVQIAYIEEGQKEKLLLSKGYTSINYV